jgi:hypothetical protein
MEAYLKSRVVLDRDKGYVALYVPSFKPVDQAWSWHWPRWRLGG